MIIDTVAATIKILSVSSSSASSSNFKKAAN